MTWPTTWESLRAYRQKAPCGCRYTTISSGRLINIRVSPNRMQRCFKHMKSTAEEIGQEMLSG